LVGHDCCAPTKAGSDPCDLGFSQIKGNLNMETPWVRQGFAMNAILLLANKWRISGEGTD
jgi:hypothetical protein